jgi:transposase
LKLDDDQIATAVGLSCNTVRCLHSRFRLYGVEALSGVGRGGRRRQNLSVEQEDEVLRPFLEEAGIGGILVVNPIKIAYEQAVGHTVPKSTVYRLLARHSWRKLAPRPRHPKASSEAQEEFKKNYQR